MATRETGSNKETIYGSFVLGSIELAINADELQEVVNLPDDLDQVPLAPDCLTGVFSLRDTVVPVLNMRKLLEVDCGDEERDEGRDCIAIVQVGDNRLGMQFDRTAEVLRVGPEQIDQFQYEEKSSARSPVQGVIRLDQGRRLVQVLDSTVLLNLPDVPRSNLDESSESKRLRLPQQTKRRCITFGCGDSRYGFRIDAVNEIIPLDGMGSIGVASDICLGRIELRGKGVAVMDLAQLLGGEASQSCTEGCRVIVVVIDGEPVGFKVDQVGGIIEYEAEELQALPDFGGDTKVLLAGCIVEQDGNDICLIDHDRLFKIPNITVPMSSRSDSISSGQVDLNTGKSTTCLLVNLGMDFGLPVASISEIIECPETFNGISGAPSFIRGVFNLRRKAVTVVNLRSLYGFREMGEQLEPKLLIAEHGSNLIGLQVDGVKDIVKVHESLVHDTPSSLLIGWSQACKDDIKQVFTSGSGVIPIMPLEAVLGRVSPNSDVAGADSTAAAA